MKFAYHACCARVLLALMSLTVAAYAQQPPPPAQPKATDKPAAAATNSAAPSAVLTANMSPTELARAAFNAQGGEKFRALKNMVLIGSVEMYSPGSTQSLSGKFGLIFAGDRMRMNIQTPLFQLEGIFDGERSYTSMPRVQLPPMNKLGLVVLAHYDQSGFQITALPDKKKERAFRITDADGNTTDFYIDAATARLTRYEIPYKNLVFSVEHTKVQEYEGVLVPVNSTWKIDMQGGAAYAEFKAKEVKLNQTLPDDVFAIPGQ
jgi:hypothetical protein